MSDLLSRRSGYEAAPAPLTHAQLNNLKAQISDEWELDAAGTTLTRRLSFKGYAKAVYTANLVAFISDRENHHADVSFGWGFCQISYTSHELGFLTEHDFICAAKVDGALSAP